MTVIDYTVNPIEVEVNDRIIGATVVKQKARFSHFAFHHNDAGEATVTVVLNVFLYAKNEDDSFGELLNGKGFQSYNLSLVADNESIVNPQTGELLYWPDSPETFEEFETRMGDATVMRQGDWFDMIARNQPVQVVPMIFAHIQTAIIMGKFN